MKIYNNKCKSPLRKLKEIGSENSRTMNRLKKYCSSLGSDICLYMPMDTELPEGYKIIIKPDTTGNPNSVKKKVLVNFKKHITVSESMTRDMVIFFTKDIADGLLEKLEKFLNKIPES